MGFDVKEYFPGVYHIGDAMGVCMTLLAGRRQAVLVDAGYGLEPAGAAVTSLTDLPCRLILTHGHHDHALGAMGFERVWMRPEDFGVYRTYTAPAQRKLVLESARAKGFAVDEAAYLGAEMPEPQPIEERLIDLGGLTLQPVHCPGHTPGSLVLYVPEYRLLLTGDDWNPTTWLFFPEALPVAEYPFMVSTVASSRWRSTCVTCAGCCGTARLRTRSAPTARRSTGGRRWRPFSAASRRPA